MNIEEKGQKKNTGTRKGETDDSVSLRATASRADCLGWASFESATSQEVVSVIGAEVGNNAHIGILYWRGL